MACALGFAVAFSTPAAMSQWVDQGPGPTLNGQAEGLPGNPVSGAVNAIAVDRIHPGTVYLGTVNGGVWKSINANTSSPDWTPLTDLKLPVLSINSIAISPLNSFYRLCGNRQHQFRRIRRQPRVWRDPQHGRRHHLVHPGRVDLYRSPH
jgi:hypothetical protein